MRRILALLLVLVPSILMGQVDPGPCDDCWDHYTYRGDFIMGGHQVPYPERFGQDLHLVFSQIYGQSPKEMAELINDTNLHIVWVKDSTHPWGGTWITTDPIGTVSLADSVTHIVKAIKYRYFKESLEHGLKFVYHPTPYHTIEEASFASEHYYLEPQPFQAFILLDTIETSPPPTQPQPAWRASNLDTLAGGFHWVYSLDTTSSDDTIRMAGRPDWIGEAFYISNGSYWLYDQAHRISYDEFGVKRTSFDSAARSALYDKRKWLSMGFAIKADVEALSDELMPGSTVIAYVDLFIRDTLAQDSCRCNTMRRWKRVSITKQMFMGRYDFTLTSDTRYVAHKDEFKEEQDQWYYDVDTLLNFSDIWDMATASIPDGESERCFYDTVGLVVDTTCLDCNVWCDAMVAERQSLGSSNPLYLPPASHNATVSADKGQFTFKFYSTGVVPISFLRSRFATNHFVELREGVYDSLIAEEIENIYADSLIDSLTYRVGLGDEIQNRSQRGWGILSSKFQQAMDEHPIASSRPKGIWVNPAHNFDGFRLFTGDYDSVSYKQVQMAARQRYLFGGGDIYPITYANPDSLSQKALEMMFRIQDQDYIETATGPTNGDTIRRRHIAASNESDYEFYTKEIQRKLGEFADYRNFDGNSPTTTNSQGSLIPSTSRLIDVFRVRYRSRFPSIPLTPILAVIQTHGYFGDDPVYQGTGSEGLPTAEVIIAQAWSTMNCGVNGLVFGDQNYDGGTVGLGSTWIDSSLRSTMEYGMLRHSNPNENSNNDPTKRVDSMWLGLKSNNAAMLEVTNDLYYIDSVIGWKNIIEKRFQISPQDERQSFVEIPMIVGLKTEKAKRHDFSLGGGGSWTFQGSDTLDEMEKTYMETTIFEPDPSANYKKGERFLLLTNRRTWPIDTLEYSQQTIDLFDSLHPWCTSNPLGLGAIDVRRPHLVFENSTDFLADSLLIERISLTSQWSTRVAFADTVELEWMLPGRGHLYKITPISSDISDHGTAYNNAVHSENPSTPDRAIDRLVVYERDSVIYFRSVDENGTWSVEAMMSNPNDTILDSLQHRTASNFFPALAVSREGSNITRFVWERDSAGYRSVVTARPLAGPIYRSTVDSIVAGQIAISRFQVSVADSLVGPPALTPSIVAIHEPNIHDTLKAGFLISWADHDVGINTVGMRARLNNPVFDTVGIYKLSASWMTNKIGQYPTLATAQRRNRINVAEGIATGTDFPDDTTIAIPSSYAAYPQAVWRVAMIAHLAWQQGDGSDGLYEQILYNRLGFALPANDSLQPSLWVDSAAEHVNQRIPACSFEHPSIAADTVRIGVAFEILESNGTRRSIGLRFRDTIGLDTLAKRAYKSWETYVYRWGGPLTQRTTRGFLASDYQRPSLTHFPSVSRSELTAQPEGGLVWYWNDDTTNRAFPQFLYRYGWFEPREIGDGKHPSLTLVPLIQSTPFASTSVLHRGDDSSRVSGINDEGTSVWYYQGRLINTPGNPMPALFGGIPETGRIYSNLHLGYKTTGMGDIYCSLVELPPDFIGGLKFDHGTTPHPPDDKHVPGDPSVIGPTPGLPPTFFVAPEDGSTIVDSLPDTRDIVRTGLFVAGDDIVKVKRLFAVSDSITTWLNSFAWDTVRNTAPDIWATVELIQNDDQSVLWRSDTISARGLDTLSGNALDDELSIPVNTAADSGKVVYARVNTFASYDVSFDISSGFTFYTKDAIPFVVPKRAVPEEELESTGGEATSLSLTAIPNPAKDRMELRIWTAEGGREIPVRIYRTSGEFIGELPTIDAKLDGSYAIEVDLGDVPPGTYLIRAESGRSVATETVTVVR